MNLLKVSLLAAALAAAPMAAQAESDFATSTNASTKLSTQASLDFQVVVPKVLFLQVGTGTEFADNTAVDLLTFNVPAANLGASGNPVAATGGNGASGVTARLVGNVGNVTLKSTTTGALSNGNAGETISFSQIAASSSLPDASGLPVPSFVDGGDSPTVAVNAVNGVINRTATWTYSYLNTVTPAAGTYGGAATNNGRVIYTAAMP